MDFFNAIRANVRTMFTLEKDGPIIYWNEQRLRIPKFLASKLAARLSQQISKSINAQWPAAQAHLNNPKELASFVPSLKDMAYIGALQKDIESYTHTHSYSRPKVTREERDAQRETLEDEKRMKITRLLLPTFIEKATNVLTRQYTDEPDQLQSALAVLHEILASLYDDAIADDVRSAVYYPLVESYTHYEDTYGDGWGLLETLGEVFDKVFPKSILKYSSEQ